MCVVFVVVAAVAALVQHLRRRNARARSAVSPEGYRRPADWKPVLYPKDLHQIARDHSAEVVARARGTLSDASDVL